MIAGAHAHQPDAAGTGAFAAFVDSARAAASGLSTIQSAVAAGYRRLGPDFPGMGEHWVHVGLIVTGRVDAAAPPVLAFARVDGEPRLVAVAYTVPLAPGELPPEHPAGRSVWHDHAGRLDEESLLLAHPASEHTGGTEGMRLAMFHLWLGLENPAGITAQNNWGLPFEQAGLRLGDAQPSADAARAVSLLSSGPDYYLTLFRSAEPELSDANIAQLRALLEGSAARVAAWREPRAQRTLEREDLAALEDEWGTLWRGILRALPEAQGERLAAVAGPLGGGRAERIARSAPFGARRVSFGLTAGSEFYASEQRPVVMGGSIALERASGIRLHFMLERTSLERITASCQTRCFADGEARPVTLWNVGASKPLRLSLDRLALRPALGVGGFSRGSSGGSRGTIAFFTGLGFEFLVVDPVALTLDLNGYWVGDLLRNSMIDDGVGDAPIQLLPSIGIGLRAGWRP
jgi:hypothetical protein